MSPVHGASHERYPNVVRRHPLRSDRDPRRRSTESISPLVSSGLSRRIALPSVVCERACRSQQSKRFPFATRSDRDSSESSLAGSPMCRQWLSSGQRRCGRTRRIIQTTHYLSITRIHGAGPAANADGPVRPCFLLPASCFLLPASSFQLPASCFLLPASCSLLPAFGSADDSSFTKLVWIDLKDSSALYTLTF
jgi:hypothetical protein